MNKIITGPWEASSSGQAEPHPITPSGIEIPGFVGKAILTAAVGCDIAIALARIGNDVLKDGRDLLVERTAGRLMASSIRTGL
jgi:hypothetical protein